MSEWLRAIIGISTGVPGLYHNAIPDVISSALPLTWQALDHIANNSVFWTWT